MIESRPTEQTIAARPGVHWEETACLLCGGERWSPVLHAGDAQVVGHGLVFAVVRCQACGLCWTNPRPALGSIGRFYPTHYRPHQSERNVKGMRWWRRPKPPFEEHRLLAWHGQGRLLDFGCGGGRFLECLQRAGWQVTGMDVSAEAVQTVRRKLGVPALQGSLPHADLRDESFDVITMIHSLEHVHQPLEVLRAAHRLLAPGGQVVVAVPNIDSLAFRWFGPAWYALDLPRHLTHFAPPSLALMLHEAGFVPGPTRMVGHSEWLRASARLAGRRWLRPRPLAWLTTHFCCWTRQADAMMITGVKR
jgi:2-polyprenyl-3-methyl-5-hydroxy-6-metoxy-1,4-benzoquinol methylase